MIHSTLFFCGAGWDWVHLVHWPLTGLSYQPQMVDGYGAFGGMRIGRGNWRSWRKPTPVPPCPPQIPHDLTWATVMGSWQLSAWAVAWPATLSYIHVGIPIASDDSVTHSSEIILIFIWKFEVVLENLGRKCRIIMAELFSCSWEDQQQEFCRWLTVLWQTVFQSNGIPGSSMVINYWKICNIMGWEECETDAGWLLSTRRDRISACNHTILIRDVKVYDVC
jgi:hypothetical protein